MEGILVFFIILGIVGFLVGTISHSVNMSFQDSLDSNRLLRKILRRAGIKPSQIYTHRKGDKRDVYPFFYGFFWLPIYIIGIFFAVYDYTLAPFFKAQNERAELRRQYITLQDIYTFKKGDKIEMKDGRVETLLTFTADSFSNENHEIFPWILAKKNETAERRNKKRHKEEKFSIFDREAKAFEKRVAEFNKAFEAEKVKI